MLLEKTEITNRDVQKLRGWQPPVKGSFDRARIGAMLPRRSFAVILLTVVALAQSLVHTAPQARNRTVPPAAPAPPLFDVFEQSILDLQAAQTAGRVTTRGLVDA